MKTNHVLMKYFFLKLLLVAFPSILLSQQNKKLDSLLHAYKVEQQDTSKVWILSALFKATEYNAPKEAKKHVDELLQLSKTIDYKPGINRAYWHLGGYYSNHKMLDSAEYYLKKSLPFYKDNISSQTIITHALAVIEYDQGNYKKALDIADKNLETHKFIKDSLGLSRSYYLKGAVYSQMGYRKLAYENHFNALVIYEKLNNKEGEADVLNKIAQLEDDKKKSIIYNERAAKIYKNLNDTYFLSQTINDIGVSYYTLADYDKAKKYFTESLALSKQAKSISIEATSLFNLGRIQIVKKKYNEALILLNKSLEIHKNIENKNGVATTLFKIGIIYNLIKQPRTAITYLTEAINIYKEIGAKDMLKEAHFERSNSYELLENYKKTLFDYEEFNIITGELYTEAKSQQIEELKTIYETEKKEQQILLQDKEINILNQKADINNLQRLLLGIGFLLSLIGFYAIRQKLKHNKLEKEKLDAELNFKKKELTTHALHLAKKNEVLEGLKQKAKQFKTLENNHNGYQQLIRTINFDLQDDNNWKNFSKYFQEVHKDFNSKIKQKYPEVTPNELRLMSLLKMNLTSKEIANILNISPEGIKKARYRLRKKLNINTDDSLQNLVLSL